MSDRNGGGCSGVAALERLRGHAVGLDVEYPLATGERTKRIYLDTTASALRLQVVQDVLDRYQPYYANTHSLLHFGAKVSTREFAWAHDMVMNFVHADPETHTAFFVGSGTTGGMNRVARTLRDARPERDVVITSVMEHHSNDLPHRKFLGEVVHVPALVERTSLGRVNMDRLREALEEYGDRVNYVAITWVSNVTGIINPVHEIAALAHEKGALVVVDAAAAAAHVPIKMCGNENPAHDIDVLVFSGHKVYAPGSPGVVVTRKDLFAGQDPMEVGGGMVDDVYLNRHMTVQKFPDREEAGTPNITGAIGLAASLYTLDRIGMDVLADEERKLMRYLMDGLRTVPDMMIYAECDFDVCERAGAVSFNLRDLDHAFVAAVLNDYFNISVRNQCFCAHPYVREMITEVLSEAAEDLDEDEIERLADLHRGMVRASLGIYTRREDIDALIAALKTITADRDTYLAHYDRLDSGDYKHKTFDFDHTSVFSVRGEVDAWLEKDPT